MTVAPIFRDNMSLEEQTKLLSTFILFSFDGEPSDDSGAIECAAKLLAKQKDEIERLRYLLQPAPGRERMKMSYESQINQLGNWLHQNIHGQPDDDMAATERAMDIIQKQKDEIERLSYRNQQLEIGVMSAARILNERLSDNPPPSGEKEGK